MGEKTNHCVLGNFHRVRHEPAQGGKSARTSYESEFVPSQKCFELMQHAANGIEGLAAVIQTSVRGSTFALVFDTGVNPDVTASLWITAFRKAASGVHKNQRGALLATTHPSPCGNPMAVSSQREDEYFANHGIR